MCGAAGSCADAGCGARPDEAEDRGWPAGYRCWLCRCGAEVSVVWSATCSLYDTDDPITADGAIINHWRLECHNGHVLLLSHELPDNNSDDTCLPPTTQELVDLLASPEDIAAWRSSWATGQPAHGAADVIVATGA